MEGVALSSAASTFSCSAFSLNKAVVFQRIERSCSSRSSSRRRRNGFLVLAAKSGEEPKFDRYDQMELKFGRLLGEDPKLTLAKIMARKANPDVSYLEVEKSFYKNKGKVVEIEELPFDVSKEKKKPLNSLDGLNLVRPVPKEGVKFQDDNKPRFQEVKKPSQPVVKMANNTKRSVPNVILRKPTMFVEDDLEDTPSRNRVKIKPNLTLKMRNDQPKDTYSDMTLLRKPEPMTVDKKHKDSVKEEVKVSGDGLGLSTVTEYREGENNMFTLLKKPETTESDFEGPSESEDGSNAKKQRQTKDTYSDMTLLRKPEPTTVDEKHKYSVNEEVKVSGDGLGLSAGTEYREGEDDMFTLLKKPETMESAFEGPSESEDGSNAKKQRPEDEFISGMRSLYESNIESSKEKADINEQSDVNLGDSMVEFSAEAALQGKPTRLDQSLKATTTSSIEETVSVNPGIYGNANELSDVPSASPLEDANWRRAEGLLKTGNREEVELISSSTRGFVVSFGSLIGFLPYRNLTAKWKFLAFESWLKQKGLDPSMYKQNIGIIESYDVLDKKSSLDSSTESEIDRKFKGEITQDMKLEDLLRIYDQEKLKFLSSFVGQRIKVNVVVADRKLRKLVFSLRPKEKEELVEKKRSVMAKLQIGDVVKCCIKKITYFGIFVEIEGVPALIHQSEVSWDATLDPSSFFKIGQIVEAKVHRLDFALHRIFLSLKEITPDPLIEALETVVGDCEPFNGRLQAAEADPEWPDVESLIKELQQVKGIQSVSKGRFSLSPGLAPTFQVYMASMFENRYKLLARSGNKVQEVIVDASLGKEEMKSTILSCTNRVE